MLSDEKIYGLIGYPLTHSFSQNYFNQKFEAEGIKARYLNFHGGDKRISYSVGTQCDHSI